MNTVSRLEEVAAAHGYSLLDLARISGVHHSTVSSAKKRGGQLTVDTIERCCNALGIPLRDFFSSAEELPAECRACQGGKNCKKKARIKDY